MNIRVGLKRTQVYIGKALMHLYNEKTSGTSVKFSYEIVKHVGMKVPKV